MKLELDKGDLNLLLAEGDSESLITNSGGGEGWCVEMTFWTTAVPFDPVTLLSTPV
jgi:hypothetical protein